MDIFSLIGIFSLGLIVGMAFGWWLYHLQKRFIGDASATRLLDRTERRLAETNKERIEAMLKPFSEQIRALALDVKDSSRSQVDLKGQLQQMGLGYQKVSEQTENLTRALKGESQTRGKWGEMILEKVLESSGLREGEEYHLQVSYTDTETSERYRPDAVISLPGGRSVIVDSKTPLVDYERYANSKDEGSLQSFLQSLRLRIKELGDKDYTNKYVASKYETNKYGTSKYVSSVGGKNFDYVLMFIPIESAFSTALEKDKGLMDYALDRNVVLVSPTTMLLALRTIHHAWRTDRQNRHAEEIAHEGGLLYDKVVSFIDDMEKHGQQLTTAQKSYDGAMKKLSSGRGNILDRTRKLEELGVKSSKKLKHSSTEEE